MRLTRANSIGRRRGAALALAAIAAMLGASGEGAAHRLSGEAAARQHAAEPARFTVSVSGDLLMHQPLLDRALANGGHDHYDFSPFFNRIEPYVEGVDVALCHLETPLGPGEPTTYPIFNTPPALARSVARSGWDGCSTASNHALDQGLGGIRSTAQALDRAGLEHTGTFASRADSREPTLISVRRGLTLGLVSYTDATNGIPVPDPWAVNVFPLAATERARREIVHDARRARRAGADAVLVNLHWGAEYAARPSRDQIRLARELTESNTIAAVVGQGPHVVSPIERMNGRFVVFSEGNLVSNQSAETGQPAATQDGLIALLRLAVRGDRVTVERLRYVPTWVRPGDYVVLPASPEEDPNNAGALRASRNRTLRVVGRGKGFGPVSD